jgi:hypothetical protein
MLLLRLRWPVMGAISMSVPGGVPPRAAVMEEGAAALLVEAALAVTEAREVGSVGRTGDWLLRIGLAMAVEEAVAVAVDTEIGAWVRGEAAAAVDEEEEAANVEEEEEGGGGGRGEGPAGMLGLSSGAPGPSGGFWAGLSRASVWRRV